MRTCNLTKKAKQMAERSRKKRENYYRTRMKREKRGGANYRTDLNQLNAIMAESDVSTKARIAQRIRSAEQMAAYLGGY